MIYLDNASTTPIHPRVLDAMLPYLKDDFGNAGTTYGLGRRAANAIAKARRQVADTIGCSSEHIIFTSGGSEANNLAIHGVLPHLHKRNKMHVITSAVEHDSVLKAVNSVCNSLGDNDKKCIKHDFDVSLLGVDESGTVSPVELGALITDNTGLVSVMYVNNESGAIMPVKALANECHKHGILFHTDCVQALGFQDIDTKAIDCDFLSISSHKINAPKGIGALYAKDPSILTPIINGGAEQEFGLRGGTENVAGIVGFGEACSIIKEETPALRSERIYHMKDVFLNKLRQSLRIFRIDDTIMHINSPQNGKILNIRFDGVDGQTLVLMLDSKDVCVSAGSACRSHETHPSKVLLAMGLTEEEAKESIRISFSTFLSDIDTRRAAIRMAECVAMFRRNIINGGAGF